MTETSCATTAASHLSSLADWIDLDGAELISNDLFSGMRILKGKILIPESPGLGIEKLWNPINIKQFANLLFDKYV